MPPASGHGVWPRPGDATGFAHVSAGPGICPAHPAPQPGSHAPPQDFQGATRLSWSLTDPAPPPVPRSSCSATALHFPGLHWACACRIIRVTGPPPGGPPSVSPAPGTAPGPWEPLCKFGRSKEVTSRPGTGRVGLATAPRSMHAGSPREAWVESRRSRKLRGGGLGGLSPALFCRSRLRLGSV